MNKTELVEIIANSADITKIKAAQVVDAFVNAVVDSLKKNEDVTLLGFGTFTTIERKARTGRNPSTGDEIQIPASISPKFKPGKLLKDATKPSQPSSSKAKPTTGESSKQSKKTKK